MTVPWRIFASPQSFCILVGGQAIGYKWYFQNSCLRVEPISTIKIKRDRVCEALLRSPPSTRICSLHVYVELNQPNDMTFQFLAPLTEINCRRGTSPFAMRFSINLASEVQWWCMQRYRWSSDFRDFALLSFACGLVSQRTACSPLPQRPCPFYNFFTLSALSVEFSCGRFS